MRTGVKRSLLRVSLHSLRILTRDKRILGHLVTDSTLLTLAKLAGLTTNDASEEVNDPDSDFYDNIIASLAQAKLLQRCAEEECEGETMDPLEEFPAVDEDSKSVTSNVYGGNLDSSSWFGSHRTSINEMHKGSIHQKALERGRRDRRESKMEGEGEEEEGEQGEELLKKEAMKVLCNVVYNSTWAQERFSALRVLTLIVVLLQEGGVPILTAALESCLEVQWKEPYECVLEPAAPHISPEASQRIVEILKILFNITYRTHKQEPSEDDAALYRHLVAILRLCLMRKCVLPEDTDELQGPPFLQKPPLEAFHNAAIWPTKTIFVKLTLLSNTILFHLRRFVKYTGYGNAAGLLATRGLLGGQGARSSISEAQYSSDSDSDTEEYRQVKDRVNPVTGRVEAEQPNPMEGMTEEEKEEEAGRLIMIFNKLSKYASQETELRCVLPVTVAHPLRSPHWMCRLLWQPSFTGCTLTHYWILLLPGQRVCTNHNPILQLLLLSRRLKACGALCGKVGGKWKSVCRESTSGSICFLLLGLQQRGGDGLMRLPASGPIFSPCRHSWRISWLAGHAADRY
ncbi:hypothetical protein GOODEAATRI_002690 [Goodea atripinnis]|uniref:Synembryn n=1 Tax=Goodea atripinnis TaxID=208336 RepID=A0ABV0MY54_9TELE